MSASNRENDIPSLGSRLSSALHQGLIEPVFRADDLLSVAADKGFHDWISKFEFYTLGVDPLVLERGSSPETIGHNALIRDTGYPQRWMTETSYSSTKRSHSGAERAQFWYREFRETVLMFAVSNIEHLCEKL